MWPRPRTARCAWLSENLASPVAPEPGGGMAVLLPSSPSRAAAVWAMLSILVVSGPGLRLLRLAMVVRNRWFSCSSSRQLPIAGIASVNSSCMLCMRLSQIPSTLASMLELASPSDSWDVMRWKLPAYLAPAIMTWVAAWSMALRMACCRRNRGSRMTRISWLYIITRESTSGSSVGSMAMASCITWSMV